MSELEMKQVGTNIRALRKKRNMTQKQLADITGLATITIQQYERGVREPRFDNLSRIAKALDVSPLLLTVGQVLSDSEVEKFKNRQPSEEIQKFNDYVEQQGLDDAMLLFHIIGAYRISLLLSAASAMTDEGIIEAIHRFCEVSEIPKYQNSFSEPPAELPEHI